MRKKGKREKKTKRQGEEKVRQKERQEKKARKKDREEKKARNKEREEKDKLFQTKVNELKTIFEKQNLNKLKNLVFDYKSERITLDDDDDTEESVDEGREIVGEGQD